MVNKYYVVKVIITSSGAEDRNLSAYDDIDTATRKFHEAFNVIGGGPKRIAVTLLDTYLNEIKKEVWLEPVPEPEEEPEETPTEETTEEPEA